MQLTTIGSLSCSRQIKPAVIGLMVLAAIREGLVLVTYFGVRFCQDYLNNVYLSLFVGVLYRLPKLAELPQPVLIPTHLRGAPGLRLALIGR